MKPKVIVTMFAVMVGAICPDRVSALESCFRDSPGGSAVSQPQEKRTDDLRRLLMAAPIKDDQADDAYAAFERRDFKTALDIWRRLAVDGNAIAQYNLGFMLVYTRVGRYDPAEAVTWFFRAQNQGNTSAQTMLGTLYYQGQGVQQDRVEALNWYRRAAAGGNAPAQFYTAMMYARGEDVEQNCAEAAKWLRLAAAQGDGLAQQTLTEIVVRPCELEADDLTGLVEGKPLPPGCLSRVDVEANQRRQSAAPAQSRGPDLSDLAAPQAPSAAQNNAQIVAQNTVLVGTGTRILLVLAGLAAIVGGPAYVGFRCWRAYPDMTRTVVAILIMAIGVFIFASGFQTAGMGINWAGQQCRGYGVCFHPEWIAIGIAILAVAYLIFRGHRGSNSVQQ